MADTENFLYENFMEDFVMIDKKTIPDDLGSFTTEWSEGARFRAALIKDKTLAARVAEKEGVTEIFTLTVKKGTPISNEDVFKRIADGSIFKVTSNIKDSETPKKATFQIGQVTAKSWELTK